MLYLVSVSSRPLTDSCSPDKQGFLGILPDYQRYCSDSSEGIPTQDILSFLLRGISYMEPDEYGVYKDMPAQGHI